MNIFTGELKNNKYDSPNIINHILYNNNINYILFIYIYITCEYT
jgi:hypothetical protein